MLMRKGFNFTEILTVLAVLTVMAIGAIAGDVYDRVQVTLGSSGSKTWTNNVPNAAIELLRFEVISGLYAADTITVRRVTAGDTSVVTNTVTGILLASGAGSSNIVNAAGSGPRHMKYGDKLLITSGNSSNATVNIEYLNQQH
jgi:prepilin-type N-terminal cleavage/methylation domain-containing protein